MDMNEKRTLITFVSLFLVATAGLTLVKSVDVESVERVVGVEVGDWIKYGNFQVHWSSDDPIALEPTSDLIEHNNTDWVINTVKSISETRITFQTLTHFKNNTETTSVSHVDINTGEGNGSFTFISANLILDESVYNSTEYANTWINETIQLVYMNTLRVTNHMVAGTTEFWPDETSGTITTIAYEIEYFWDRTTGTLLERAGSFVRSREEYTIVAQRSEIVIDTNLWEEEPDTTPPTAEAGPDRTVALNEMVVFDAGSSSDNEGGWGIASYDWVFGDGTYASGSSVAHAFDTPGKYTVKLTVRDWAGNSNTDTLIVTVQEPSSPPWIIGVVILLVLLVAGLFFWRLKAKK